MRELKLTIQIGEASADVSFTEEQAKKFREEFGLDIIKMSVSTLIQVINEDISLKDNPFII